MPASLRAASAPDSSRNGFKPLQMKRIIIVD
jgi:hypothetical protein